MLQIVENTGKFGAKCICTNCRSIYHVRNRYGARQSRVGHLCVTCKKAITNMGDISQSKLQNVYNYNQITGIITHRNTTSIANAGEVATGKTNSVGYLVLSINKKTYLAHRIIYTYMTGKIPEYIDHINHVRTDNRWVNIREVSNTDNTKNTSLSKNSITGINGVSLHRPTGKYRAYIMVNRKQIHLGLFDTIVEAKAARHAADIRYDFHKNHGN